MYYHITSLSRYLLILENGFRSSKKKIYVVNTSELGVLLSVALEQLPDSFDNEGFLGFAILKINGTFDDNLISTDSQAPDAWTLPHHRTILSQYIPPENIQLFMLVNLSHEEEFIRASWASSFSKIVEEARLSRINK